MLTSKLESKHWVITFTPHLTDAEWAKLADLGFWDYCYEERWVTEPGTTKQRKVGVYNLDRALQALRRLDWITIIEARMKSDGEISAAETNGDKWGWRNIRPITG